MVGILVAIAAGVLVFVVALWIVRMLATPPEPEPDPEEIHEVSVDYACSVCGLRLTVTHAQPDDPLAAPRHCREEMVEV